MHHRDLPGRPAEGERGDARPHPHRLAEGHAVIWNVLHLVYGDVAHAGPLDAELTSI